MNIRDLKYLIAVADYGHFGNAAESCFVSQPALSMQIKKLEDTLGVQLIERTNKSVRLTEIGKLITAQARDILCSVDRLKETADQARDPFKGELRLGIIPTLAPYLLPCIIPSITKIFPNISLFLIENQTTQLINQLQQGHLDSILVALPVIDSTFTTRSLFDEEFMLAVPAIHPLTKRKKMNYEALTNEQLLLLEDGHCLRDQALSICHLARARESGTYRAASLETLRQMVSANAGITLLPKLAVIPTENVCYLPFAAPKPSRTIGMVWRTSTSKKLLLENLLLTIKKIMAKQKSVSVTK